MSDSTVHQTSPLGEILPRLEGVYQLKPNEFMAYDPTYDDGRKHNRRGGLNGGQSLHITEYPDKVVMYSFGRGKDATFEILDKIGLKPRDLFSQSTAPPPTSPPRLVDTYDYLDRDGVLIYQVLRFEPKDFKQRQPNGGGWVYKLTGVERLLYRLPQLIAEPTRWVTFTEGERCANRLAELGMLSTCIAGGTNGPIPPTMVDDLRSHAGVAIYPDNDAPGAAFAEKIARMLYEAGIPVKVVQL